MPAYYNEHDKGKCAWLKELIEAGVIAPGDVDDRSVSDVAPSDLVGYTQCHFFAGIGVWSYALRLAGWPDDRPVWTGSCPCQSFSSAGKRLGFADERHLWPYWFWLVSQRRPGVVFGEQVASKDALAWLDLVSADLEGEGYAIGALDLCAAGFGAPHPRQRFYWVADARLSEPPRRGDSAGRNEGQALDEPAPCGGAYGLEKPERIGRGRGSNGDSTGMRRQVQVAGRSTPGGLGDSERVRLERHGGSEPGRTQEIRGMREPERPSATNGFWADAEWVPCRDGFLRPTEPGTFPLAHGAPARVLRLCGYGDAIVAEVAAEFIQAYMQGAC